MTHRVFFSNCKWWLSIVMLFILTNTYAAKPRWISTLPKAENATYRYDAADATGTTEESARNKALAKILLNAKSANTGLSIDADGVNNVALLGNENPLVYLSNLQMRIPVKHVCSYRQQLKNGLVRVYVLCQVSVDASAEHQFTEFRHCGSSGDDEVGIVSLRPEEWECYENGNTYFSKVKELNTDKESIRGMGTTLETAAKTALIDQYGFKDSVLHIMITTKSVEYPKQNEAYAIAYVKRDDILDYYTKYVKDELDICTSWLDNVTSYLFENRINDAAAQWEKTQKKHETLQPYITFLETYESVRHTAVYTATNSEIKNELAKMQTIIDATAKESREDKVKEYIGIAEGHINRCAIGDALRYLYAAQLIITDLGAEDIIKYKGGYAKDYIQTTIKEVLSKIEVQCDGYIPQYPTEYKLSFRYPKGTIMEPITNISFAANINEGWSDILGAHNGWSSISITAGTKPHQAFIRLDYRCEAEAAFDPELLALMEKYHFNYDNFATKSVPLLHQEYNMQAAVNRHSTSINQNVVAEQIKETYHRISGADSARYHAQTLEVINAIQTKNLDQLSLMNLFTKAGFTQYQRMMKYGNPHVITSDVCRYLQIGDDVQCRSIPMTFSFTKGKRVSENVILVYNSEGKVDAIQFALDERSARNIMGSNNINEKSKLFLIHFMENYQTAFAMQNWDYIESIFSDDAVIITGRRVYNSGTTGDTNKLFPEEQYEYLKMTKGQYLNRLRNSKKEWINIKFGHTKVEQSSQQNMYGICLLQDYYSSNYGDHGYLFLLIDARDSENPIIRVRTWQPESDGSIPFTISDYDRLTSGIMRY